RRPFKAVTGIRTPLGARQSGGASAPDTQGPVVQFGVHAALSRRRPRVQIPSGPRNCRRRNVHAVAVPGRVAQLAERAPDKRGGTGSTPVPATCSPDEARERALQAFAFVDLLEELPDLARAESAVTTERANRGDLPCPRPTRHSLRVHAEHGGDFRR